MVFWKNYGYIVNHSIFFVRVEISTYFYINKFKQIIHKFK